jgi:hypothetical protein
MSEAVKNSTSNKFFRLLFYISLITLLYWASEALFLPCGIAIVELLFQALYYPVWIVSVVLPFAIFIQGILNGFKNRQLILAIAFCLATIIILYYRGQPIYD